MSFLKSMQICSASSIAPPTNPSKWKMEREEAFLAVVPNSGRVLIDQLIGCFYYNLLVDQVHLAAMLLMSTAVYSHGLKVTDKNDAQLFLIFFCIAQKMITDDSWNLCSFEAIAHLALEPLLYSQTLKHYAAVEEMILGLFDFDVGAVFDHGEIESIRLVFEEAKREHEEEERREIARQKAAAAAVPPSANQIGASSYSS